MKQLIGPVLTLAASAWGEAPRVQVSKGFTPNPMLVSVRRAEGGAAQLESSFATCKDLAPGAQVSKSPVALLQIADGVKNLTVQASQADRVIVRSADGIATCGEKLLTLPVKPGALEVFLVTAAAVPAEAAGKLRIFDADRPRLLPDAVKTLAFDGTAPLTLTGDLAAAPRSVPDAQLDVTAKLDKLEWKLDGAATEVWLSTLALEDTAPVKAGESLAVGRYAVWVRGIGSGAFTVTATPKLPGVAEVSEPTPAADSAATATAETAADAAPPESEPAADTAPQAKDEQVKAPQRTKKQIQWCIDHHPEWPDAAKRCSGGKADKSRSKVEAKPPKSSAKGVSSLAKRAKALAAARP